MKRKISFAILSLLILAAGLTASKKLNYLESSLWIFRLNPEKQTETKTDPRYDESEKSKSPGVSEERFSGRKWRRETNKINLRNVVWFAAIFASFTVIAIYADQGCRFIRRKRKDKHKC